MNALFNQWDVVVILLQIIAIDLLLGGDNAVVIAMACRKLPPEQRTKAIVIGTFGAILARVLLLAIAVYLLSLPWLKIVGALLLLWIHQDEDEEIGSSGSLWRTAVTITVADVIMSMDNVLAVAAAGKGHLLLVALGVLISIPIIVAGSKLVLAILNRFPVVILLGGALIGWIAGSMWVTDPTIVRLFPQAPDALPLIAGALGAALVLLEGLRRNGRARPAS